MSHEAVSREPLDPAYSPSLELAAVAPGAGAVAEGRSLPLVPPLPRTRAPAPAFTGAVDTPDDDVSYSVPHELGSETYSAGGASFLEKYTGT